MIEQENIYVNNRHKYRVEKDIWDGGQVGKKRNALKWLYIGYIAGSRVDGFNAFFSDDHEFFCEVHFLSHWTIKT